MHMPGTGGTPVHAYRLCVAAGGSMRGCIYLKCHTCMSAHWSKFALSTCTALATRASALPVSPSLAAAAGWPVHTYMITCCLTYVSPACTKVITCNIPNGCVFEARAKAASVEIGCLSGDYYSMLLVLADKTSGGGRESAGQTFLPLCPASLQQHQASETS